MRRRQADVLVHVEPGDARSSRRRCSVTSSARNASCELPVASITFASPRASIASRIALRPRRPPRRAPASSTSSKTRTVERVDRERGSRGVTRTAGATARSRRASRRSSAATWSKSMRPASGSSSIASTTRVAVAGDRGLHGQLLRRDDRGAATRRAPAGSAAVVAAGEAVGRRRCTSSRPPTSAGRSGHWPAFGMFSGKLRGLSRRNESIIGATISPDGMFGTSVDLRELGELGLVAVDPHLAVGDRREADAPALAPLRLLGEEAGEELHEVAVARAGQHAEAVEQLELHLVARDEIALGELRPRRRRARGGSRRGGRSARRRASRDRRAARAGGPTRLRRRRAAR